MRSESSRSEAHRLKTLDKLGLSSTNLRDAWSQGRRLPYSEEANPYLVSVCDDPLLSGCLTYILPPGEEVSVGSSPECSICISGPGIQAVMCSLISLDQGA